jgi:hypothetical protein
VCCFSVPTPVGLLGRILAPTVHVSATNIFARMLSGERQALAYGMNLSTPIEVAMILPLPVAPGAGEEAAQFVDLSRTPRMFEELHELFELSPPLRSSGGITMSAGEGPRLVVHEVGSFVASYVPTRADFSRLDPRFRLPEALFDAVPRYADYGFAVFQLARGQHTIHPMALTFRTRAQQLFFPTVHLHDGRFHRRAKFDHALYFQTPRFRPDPLGPPPRYFEDATVAWKQPGNDYQGLLQRGAPLLRSELRGTLPNQDTWITA